MGNETKVYEGKEKSLSLYESFRPGYLRRVEQVTKDELTKEELTKGPRDFALREGKYTN